jgi:hypothetical protein
MPRRSGVPRPPLLFNSVGSFEVIEQRKAEVWPTGNVGLFLLLTMEPYRHRLLCRMSDAATIHG